MISRRPIQSLPVELVNRIAAGEVIERPASIVKELVENSLDAGASHITVEIEDGGRALIRVIDDGSGIPPAELPLAFAPHATNKLACDDDLFRIATMGFRGEALASVGAVAQARIVSRTSENPLGYEINNRGGMIETVQAAAANIGTVIEVRNLFFNVPARRKFLKGTATEFGHISETVLRLALPFPQVAFRLLHHGKVTLDLPACEAVDRLLAAWPKEFHAHRLPIDGGDVEIKLTGILGLPDLARPTQKYQYVYLNGRSIRDRFIQHAVREAYRGLTEPGRHPAAVILINMPPGDVDVNVHPTKNEVRFRDSNRLHGMMLSGVRRVLLANDLTPQATATPMDGFSIPNPQIDMREKLAAFFKGAIPDSQPAQQPGAMNQVNPSNMSGMGSAMPNWALQPSAPVQGNLPMATDSHSDAAGSAYPIDTIGKIDTAQPPASHVSQPPLRASIPGQAIQLHNSYLVAQSDDGMIIIDQHALHERIMYEELLNRLERGPLESQHLLLPQTTPASSRQLELLEQIQPLLQRLGIHAAAFGPDAAAVHAFPTFLHRLDPGIFLRELLERGEQELLDLNTEELLHEILDMMACKAAVKAGDPLSSVEIEALLQRRHLIDRSSNCPHGRPTTLRLSLRDLEKQFKRTGF